jgi:hypothetical protein
MAQIQITDLNPSDFGFMEELTDEELLAINGGDGTDPRVLAALLRALADTLAPPPPSPPCTCGG